MSNLLNKYHSLKEKKEDFPATVDPSKYGAGQSPTQSDNFVRRRSVRNNQTFTKTTRGARMEPTPPLTQARSGRRVIAPTHIWMISKPRPAGYGERKPLADT